ncbi:baculoviral IAP repeat-containing protein 3-like [Mytilus trossulus]|uniref:baculoviral IAP repeat-containing protein 3-like n=1 Tax=Mytilus trossulus TaxID=6551 RepID=UPI003007A393
MVRLAGAGFYSTGNSTETKCFLCEVIYSDWISGDDPMHIHRQISPLCDVVANGNRQDTLQLQNKRRQSRMEVQPSTLNNISTTHVTLDSNEHVYSSNVLTSGRQNDDISDITSSDRHFHHHDIVEDQPTVVSPQWSQSNASNTYSDKNPTINCKNNSQNIGITNNSTACNYKRGSSNNHLDIGIQNQNPRYVNYAPLQVRISSFEGWPGYLNQTPREMALAGFLFAGYHDYTRCFHCGGGLRNWEAGDDPWVEHARWFPQCGFLKQNKGEHFIQAVLKKHYMDQKGNENSTYSPKNQQEDRTVTSNRNTTMASTSVAGLDKSNMCTPNYQVQEQSNSRNSSSGIQPVTNDSTTVASRVNTTYNYVSTTNIEHTERRILQTIAARTVIEMGFNSHQVIDAVIEIQRLSSGKFEGFSDVSATDIMNVLLREDHQQTVEVLNVQETSTGKGIGGASFDDTHLILEENRQLQEQSQCKVCREFDSTVAFLPCGHIVCCTDCAPAMRKCPVCKTYVKGTVKTFLA